MKKCLLISLLSVFGYSQQVLKKITIIPENTTVELYTFRNGTSSGNVVGNENFAGTTTFEDINFYTSDSGMIYNSHFFGGPGIEPSSETICNGSFMEIGWTAFYLEFCDDPAFCDDASNRLPINVYYKYTSKDEISDDNSDVDLLTNRYTIPNVSNGNTAIPWGTWAVLGSREGNDETAGVFIEKKYVCLRFDGIAWILQTTYPNGSAIPDVADVCASTMEIYDLKNYKSQIAVTPNPAEGFITIQNLKKPTGKFSYKIVDLRGQIIKNGQSEFNHEINIDDLSTGNYFINIKDESEIITNKKFIKN